jgi:limonene-1,2-epoxide hydrolase
MIDLSIARNDNERLALMILKAMEDGELVEQIEALCTDDFVWANSGLPTLNGKADIYASMRSGGFAQHIPILETMTSFSADLLHIASSGNIVFTERLDHHWDSEGRDLMTPHIAGVIEVANGKISALRDFFDTVCFRQEPTEPRPAHARS